MEIFAGAPLLLSLAVLALVDSLSIGTLLIPLFLLLAPGRVRVGRVLLYLVTIAGFYLVVGLLFLWGLVNVVDVAAEMLSSPAGAAVRLVVGAGLLVGSFLIPTSSKQKVPAGPTTAGEVGSESATADPAGQGRIARWRARLLAPDVTRWAIVSVAIAAGVVEVATMVPYIVGMTMLADSGVDTSVRVLALVGYCLVMIVPALMLLLVRVVAARAIAGPLERLAAWMQRTAGETTAWIIGILGFLIARAAATELGLFEFLGG
ncbi:GAP family protein [Microbacterium sp. CIAB417]|uniref:GAP family protein n=1 Tax=Microbacterium sp. CIAB417 TaxID=2860287 RepID=UPI001FACCF0E|nr:GAP family protein [Microbacterium sp. CIAB417]